MEGRAKPIRADVGPHERAAVHKSVSVFRRYTNSLLGMCSISVKKSNEEIKRNSVKKGEKIQFPRHERREIGSPHAIKKGSETHVRINWS
jgi:hypothetical protein